MSGRGRSSGLEANVSVGMVMVETSCSRPRGVAWRFGKSIALLGRQLSSSSTATPFFPSPHLVPHTFFSHATKIRKDPIFLDHSASQSVSRASVRPLSNPSAREMPRETKRKATDEMRELSA